MSDQEVTTLEVTAEERQFIELLRQAHDAARQQLLMRAITRMVELIQAGDKWPDRAMEYLEALLEAEVLLKEVEQGGDTPDETENPDWRTELRQGFVDAVMGNTRPVSELLAELNNDDETANES
jgi:hypothetical protein